MACVIFLLLPLSPHTLLYSTLIMFAILAPFAYPMAINIPQQQIVIVQHILILLSQDEQYLLVR
jgi:hypothetical protein